MVLLATPLELMTGCITNKNFEELGNLLKEDIALTGNVTIYYFIHNKRPDSIEQLQAFCPRQITHA